MEVLHKSNMAYHGENQDGEIFFGEDAESATPLVSLQGKIDLDELSHTVEDLVIQSLLEQGLAKNDVAKLLGISRQALYQKCKRSKATQT